MGQSSIFNSILYHLYPIHLPCCHWHHLNPRHDATCKIENTKTTMHVDMIPIEQKVTITELRSPSRGQINITPIGTLKPKEAIVFLSFMFHFLMMFPHKTSLKYHLQSFQFFMFSQSQNLDYPKDTQLMIKLLFIYCHI